MVPAVSPWPEPQLVGGEGRCQQNSFANSFRICSNLSLNQYSQTTPTKNPKSTRIFQTSQPTPPTSSSGPTDGLSLPPLPETEKLRNDALPLGSRLGFQNKNLNKRILFIKEKSSEVVGLVYFLKSKGHELQWEGGCSALMGQFTCL